MLVENPKVSVLMPAYKQAELVGQTLDYKPTRVERRKQRNLFSRL